MADLRDASIHACAFCVEPVVGFCERCGLEGCDGHLRICDLCEKRICTTCASCPPGRVGWTCATCIAAPSPSTPEHSALPADVLSDLLSLVDRVVPAQTIEGWTAEQRSAAEEWAGALHLFASDNEHVAVPPEPEHVRGAPRVERCYGTRFSAAPRQILAQAPSHTFTVDETRVVDSALAQGERDRERVRQLDRSCVELGRALGRVAEVLGEPEAEPDVLVDRLAARLRDLDPDGDRIAVPAPQLTRRALSLLARARARCEDRLGLHSLGQSGRCLTEPKHALAVLAEEFGEVARALLDHEGDGRLLIALVDTAQVCVAWAEVLLADGDQEDVREAVRALEGGAL